MDDPEFEEEELAQIYVERGVEVDLARKVAVQLMAKDSLGAHARDELGISENHHSETGAGCADFSGDVLSWCSCASRSCSTITI